MSELEYIFRLLYCAFFKLLMNRSICCSKPAFWKKLYCPSNVHEGQQTFPTANASSLHSPFLPTTVFMSHCSKIFCRVAVVTVGAILFTRFRKPSPDQSRPSHEGLRRRLTKLQKQLTRASVIYVYLGWRCLRIGWG